MRKRLISIILIMMMIVPLSSCIKGSDERRVDNDTINNTDKIQLWYYDFKNMNSHAVSAIVSSAKEYCRAKNIPLEIISYDENTISYEDYILKRNLALSYGNMIVIESPRFMQDIAKHHADYTKIENYNNLLSIYKDRFCIPLGIVYETFYLENKAMEYYGINTYTNPIITYYDYLEMKQDMKKMGARFVLNSRELDDLTEYYLNINGLLYINYDSEILQNENKLKEMLKKSVLDLCNDIIIYNNGKLETENEEESSERGSHIYDENSELTLWEDWLNTNGFFNVDSLKVLERDIDNFPNKTLMVNSKYSSGSPCFYMYKKITNDKIYDLANYIVSESSYLLTLRVGPAPIFNIQGMEKTKEELSINDNWEFVAKEKHGTVPKRFKMIINGTYEIFAKNEEKSRQLADAYFSNRDYGYEIKSVAIEIVKEIAGKLSIDTNGENLSLEKFDYKDEEMNKMIDNRIDEFVKNFLIHNN